MEAQPSQTLQILQRFNQAFVQHDGSLLGDLIAEDCVMESVEPAPDGTRYVGRSACLEFWQKLAHGRDGAFADEDIVAIDEHGIIRWRRLPHIR
jgi:SnoaL-like domain